MSNTPVNDDVFFNEVLLRGRQGISRRQTLMAGAGLLAATALPNAAAYAHPLAAPNDVDLVAALQGRYTIRQVSSGRYVDAHESADQDFRLVTRPWQNNDT